jgi:hypothetical protein
MIIRENLFFSNISSKFYPEKTGGMGEKSPNYVRKIARFWGGYVRQE